MVHLVHPRRLNILTQQSAYLVSNNVTGMDLRMIDLTFTWKEETYVE